MGEVMVGRYWCHMCSQIVNPVENVREVGMKCPFCDSGFVEEMGGGDNQEEDTVVGSDRAISLWAPILLGMMGRGHRRLTREPVEDEQEEEGGDFESILQRRRRRSSTAILHLLQGLRAGIIHEHEDESERETDHQNPHREHVILINPFNQAIILQGSSLDANQNQNQTTLPASLGDYLIGGAGLDLLLHHLAENDPNRYGTPPAKKDAIDALPTVNIGDNLQCSVCLDDFEIGGEAKEMPCKHKFHSECILPWLKLHSSCPVCRAQMPSEEDTNANASAMEGSSSSRSAERPPGGEEGGNGNGRRNWLPIPWPFHGLFSQSGGATSSDEN